MRSFESLPDAIDSQWALLKPKFEKASGVADLTIDSGDEYNEQLEVCIWGPNPDNNSYNGSYDNGRNHSLSAAFNLGQLPACCGIVIVTDLSDNAYAKYGLEFCEAVAKTSGYTGVMYITIPNQKKIIGALRERRYRQLSTFKSQRTGNLITTWMKVLKMRAPKKEDFDDDYND